MKVLVVIGHQRLGSFCHALVRQAVVRLERTGHEVFYHDLYQERFDPLLEDNEISRGSAKAPVIAQHCRELTLADGYVIVHPNWWGQPPAILKGWIDRVFCQGVAYEFAAGGKIVGHLVDKTALVFNTSNTPRDMELQLYGDPLENLWRTCIFGFCGLTRFHRRNFESIVMSTPQQRQLWLTEADELVQQYFPPTS